MDIKNIPYGISALNREQQQKKIPMNDFCGPIDHLKLYRAHIFLFDVKLCLSDIEQ